MAPHRPTPKKDRRLRPLNSGSKNFKGQLPSRQLQLAIYKLHKYFRREALNNGPLRSVKQVGKRISDALGIGNKLITRVTKIGDSGQPFVTPGKQRNVRRKKREVDDFTKCAIRNLIYEFHSKRQHLTANLLLAKIRERGIDFCGGMETLRKLMRDLGFKYHKRNGTKYLMEQTRIALLRLQFLRRFRRAIIQGKKYLVYLDETWIFKQGSGLSRAWQDKDVRSCPVRKVGCGGRYIVIHAGGRDGFVSGAGKVWPSALKPQPGDDYHGDMNGNIFKTWFTKDFLPNLDKPSIIVMDNASYHSCQEEDEKNPTSKATKEDIKAWLSRNNIPYDTDMMKKELLALARLHKRRNNYIIEGLLKGTEHEILRLPPYHACFNPIELVWGLVKRYFDAHVGRDHDYSDSMMLKIFEEALAAVTPKVWKNICLKVEKKIMDAYNAEIRDDDDDFKFIINFGSDDEEVDNEEDDEWATVSAAQHFGTYQEQESDDDPDDPDPVSKIIQPNKKKTKVELACGISFEEIVPKVTVAPITLCGKASSHFNRIAKRSLFNAAPQRFTEKRAEVSHLSGDETAEFGCKPLHTMESICGVVEPLFYEDPEMTAVNDVAILEDFSRLQDQDSAIIHRPISPFKEQELWYSPVDVSVSLAWNLIPTRHISPHEVEAAVCSVLTHTGKFDSHIPSDTVDMIDIMHWSEPHSPVDFVHESCSDVVDENQNLIHEEQHPPFVDGLSLKEQPKKQSMKPRVSTFGNDMIVSDQELKSLQCFNIPSNQVVDKYLRLIAKHYSKPNHTIMVYPSGFYKYVIALNKGDSSLAPNYDPFGYDIVFIPVHLSSLWCFCVVWPKKKVIRFLSTLGERHEECLDAVVHFVALEHKRLKQECISWIGWSCESDVDAGFNHSLEDGAIVVCCWARRACEGLPLTFCSDDLNWIRQQMQEELRDGRLKDLVLPSCLVDCSKKQVLPTDSGSILRHSQRTSIPLQSALEIFGIGVEIGTENTATLHFEDSQKEKYVGSPNKYSCTKLPFKNLTSMRGPPTYAQSDACSHQEETKCDFIISGESASAHPPVTLTSNVSTQFQQKDIVVTLSDSNDEELLVQRTLAELGVLKNTSVEEILKMPSERLLLNRHKFTLKVQDLMTLSPSEWLNDEVINVYMSTLCDASSLRVYLLNTHFYPTLVQGGYGSVQRWTKKVNIFECHLVIVPVHLGVHWALVVVDMQRKTVTYYDSMPSRNVVCANNIKIYLEHEHEARKSSPLGNEWLSGNAERVPKQNNDFDCGVYSCMFAKVIVQRSDHWPFNSADMNGLRKKMISEILSGEIDFFKEMEIQPSTLRLPSTRPFMPLPYAVKGIKGALLIQSGNLHQNSQCFPDDRRNAQCTAISACALFASAHLQRPFTCYEMDAIVKAGDDLYVQCRTAAVPVDENWLSVDDLPKIVECLGIRVNFEIEYVAGGSYKDRDNRTYNLSDAIKLELVRSHSLPLHGYFFVGRSKTVTFWPGHNDDEFFLFNSHCVSRDNRAEGLPENGAARLFLCDGAIALSRLIMADDVCDHNVWVLIRAKITHLTRL